MSRTFSPDATYALSVHSGLVKNVLEPNIEHLLLTLEPYKSWQPENLWHMLPVKLEFHADILERIRELEQIVDNEKWPEGVGEEARKQLRKFIKEDIEGRFVSAIINGARAVIVAARQNSYYLYTLNASEMKTLLYYYISARVMVLIRLCESRVERSRSAVSYKMVLWKINLSNSSC